MNNNVIVILVDSVFSQCIGKRRTKISSTPFIDELASSGASFKNVFSYGPYTDAATKGLYCVEHTLDNYGYYYGINSSDNNHFREFKENGFETYGFYYPYYLVGSKVEKDIDHSIYTSGFLFQSVWFGKLEYYSKIQKQRSLTDIEYSVVIKCLDMVFDCWKLFYSNLANEESGRIINRLRGGEINGNGCEGLDNEILNYNLNKRKYVDNLLELGMEHPLAKINEFDFSKHINRDFLENEIYEKHADFFRKTKMISLRNAILDPEISLKEFLDEIVLLLKDHNKDHLRCFINYGMYLFAYSYFKKSSFKNNWQLMASMNKQIEVLCDLLKDRDSNRPFYASLHVLEPHHNISFFSYDADDVNLINEEIEYLYPLLSNNASDKCGNILYQLSLRYVDLCVKRLFDELKEMGCLNNTTVMIMADHGSSYTYKNIRTSVTNNFHIENYNVPLLIWDANMSNQLIGEHEGFYSSSDIFPLLWNMLQLNIDYTKYPHSINCVNKSREFVMLEYMGPGCPDMMSRDVWIAARNRDYVIGYKININDLFDIDNPTDIYELKKDIKERKNMRKSIKPSEVPELTALSMAVKERFYEIKNQTKSILADFDSFLV